MEHEQFSDNAAEMIEKRFALMRRAVLQAGEYVRGSEERGQTVKSNSKDFVTTADIKSQDIMRGLVRGEDPESIFLSEEDSEEDRVPMHEPGFTGYVADPIDGTYNFDRDMRESAISLGYVENGESLIGVVYDPFKDELFTAIRGQGAFRNGEPITVNQNYKGLRGASIGPSNSYDDEAMARNLERHLAIFKESGVMPWTHVHGSGVLIMTNIACGRFDAYHHNGLKPWDNAAAFLIIREAGGVVETLTGETAPFTSSTVLAGTPGAVADLRAVFSKLDPELLK